MIWSNQAWSVSMVNRLMPAQGRQVGKLLHTCWADHRVVQGAHLRETDLTQLGNGVVNDLQAQSKIRSWINSKNVIIMQ